MKILLVSPKGGAFYYIIRGYKNALEHIGHEVEFWNGQKESFDEFQPDIYIGCSGWKQAAPRDLIKKFGTKLVMHANPYGNNPLKIVANGPDINEPEDTITWVKSQNPDLIFGYGYKSDLNRYWSGWYQEAGINVCMAPPAGDCFSFYEVEPDPKFRCDLAFVGGRWKYKAHNLDKYIVPLTKQYDIRIYGWGGWNGVGKTYGKINDSDVLKLFSSAKIGPCVHEPHTAVYGIDVPERIFKVPLCGLMAVSDPSSSLHQYFPKSIMPMAGNPKEYRDLIDYYLKNDSERKEITLKQKAHVIKNHTYLSRIASIFAGLSMRDEVIKAHNYIDDLKGKHGIN